MKKIITIFTLSILLLGFIFGAASASSPNAALLSSKCGDTYTVERGDSLSEIASKCGITFGDILALNPQITNPSLIYIGQVIRMSGSAPYSLTQITPLTWLFQYYSSLHVEESGDIPYIYYPPDNNDEASVSLSKEEVEPGDSLTVYVSGFPANAPIDYRIGEWGETYTDVYDGRTDVNGRTSQKLTIPNNANAGEYWVVLVMTTDMANGVSVYSPTIYIVGGNAGADVSLSTTTVEAGKKFTVYVSGFPANADIDYRLGRKDQPYSVVYDGTVDANGEDSFIITMPGDAVMGERWIVLVTTTNLVNVVEAYSPIIEITD